MASAPRAGAAETSAAAVPLTAAARPRRKGRMVATLGTPARARIGRTLDLRGLQRPSYACVWTLACVWAPAGVAPVTTTNRASETAAAAHRRPIVVEDMRGLPDRPG